MKIKQELGVHTERLKDRILKVLEPKNRDIAIRLADMKIPRGKVDTGKFMRSASVLLKEIEGEHLFK